MGTLTTIQPGRRVLLVLLGLALCLNLWGCGLVNPSPPRAVVEAAIAQKLSQTQAVLYRQIAPALSTTDLAQVSRISIADHHWTAIANQPAVAVTGTYQLKGGSLTAAQRRQTRSFDLYLRRGEAKDQWLLLEPVPDSGEGDVPWRTTPLTRPS
jgi:hypothetical protein